MIKYVLFVLFLSSCVNKDISLVREYKYSDYCENKQSIKNCFKLNSNNTSFEIYITKDNNKQLDYPIKLFDVSITNNDIIFKLFYNKDKIIKTSDNIIYNNIFSELCEWGHLPNTYHKDKEYIVKFNNKPLKEELKITFDTYLNKYGIIYK